MAANISRKKVIVLVREIDRAVNRGTDVKAHIQAILRGQSDQKIATILDIDPDHRLSIFSTLAPEQKAAVLDYINSHTLRSLISHLSDHEVVGLIEKTPTPVSQKVTQVIERSRLNRLVPMIVDETRRQNLLNFVNYPARSVGRIMQPEVPLVRADMTVQDAVREVSGFDTSNGPVYQVYVLDHNGKFTGTIPLSDLVKSGNTRKIGDLYVKKPPAITPATSQSKAARFFRQYDLIEAPVVAEGDKIVGRVLVDDILDVIQQEFAEDVQKFAGITAEETLETPVFASSRRRLPWMIINVFLALIAVSVIMPFQATIAEVTALAVLMPVVSNMGGNIGIQSLTVSIRALADSRPQWRLAAKELSKEIRLGVLNGAILGVIIGIVTLIGWQKPYLGLVAMGALIFNTVLASIIGGVLPIILHKLKKDPAMMSGMVLTTMIDFFGFLTFLSLARIFIEYIV
jgi:magnesium transporter